MEGWIKLHRDLLNHWVAKDPEELKVWIYCLLDATHTYSQRKVKGKIIDLYPGQTIFGRNEWAKMLDIEASKVYRTIQRFEEAGMITVFTVKGQYSIITICNWTVYQHEKTEQQNAQQPEQGNEQGKGAAIQEGKEIPEQQIEQHLNSKRTHNKNGKNEKNDLITYTVSELEVLNHWNSKGIVVHGETAEMKKEIKKALDRHGKDKVIQGIDHYAAVFEANKKDGYWYSHKWRLDKFLKQNNGLPDFLEEGQQWINFMTHKQNGGKKAAPPGKNVTPFKDFKQRQYDKDFYNSLYENG